jgi:DNA-binding NarL/FixJ family response regulator
MENTAVRMIRVLIADDHPVVRQGIRAALSSEELEVVAEASDGRELLAAAVLLKPDVVVVDVRMPNLGGLQALRAIREKCPHARAVLFTSYADEDYVRAAMAAGASAYLLKGSDGQELLGVVRRVAAGENLLDQERVTRITSLHRELDLAMAAVPPGELQELTRREREILIHIAKGLAPGQIAQALEVSRNTVKSHTRHLFQKIGVANRAEAILWAVGRGLIAPADVRAPGLEEK